MPDSDHLEELPELIQRMDALLCRLDILELYDAGAYLSMAVHTLDRRMSDSPTGVSTAPDEPGDR